MGGVLAVGELLDDRPAPCRSGSRSPRPIEPDSPPSRRSAVRIEELIPTTWPVMSTSGPPELPGLIAASVWIASVSGGLCRCRSRVCRSADRDRAVERADDAGGDGGLQAERRPDRDHRLADLEVAGLADGRPGSGRRRPAALITARSVTGSVPSTVAFFAVPSLKFTVIVAAVAGDRDDVVVGEDLPVRAEDDAATGAGALTRRCTLIFTTDGSTASATCSTVPAWGAAVSLPPGRPRTGGDAGSRTSSVPPPTRSSAAVNPAAPARPLSPPTSRAAARIPATAPLLGAGRLWAGSARADRRTPAGTAGRRCPRRSGGWSPPEGSRLRVVRVVCSARS